MMCFMIVFWLMIDLVWERHDFCEIPMRRNMNNMFVIIVLSESRQTEIKLIKYNMMSSFVN